MATLFISLNNDVKKEVIYITVGKAKKKVDVLNAIRSRYDNSELIVPATLNWDKESNMITVSNLLRDDISRFTEFLQAASVVDFSVRFSGCE